MCGVAGFWHLDKRAMDGAALRRMTRALAHRGPDAEGYYEAPGIGLGHRSLQLLQHLFVDNFQPSGSEISHEERTPVAL